MKKILSILLVIVMIFSILPTVAFAENEEGAVPVAEISDTEYSSLQDAFAAAEDGDTVYLLTDVDFDGSAEIDVSRNITFDCNGCKLSNESSSVGCMFNVKSTGTLSFVNLWSDAGTLDSLVYENYGTVRFMSTSAYGAACDDYFVYYNYGTVEVLGGNYMDCYAFVEYNGDEGSAQAPVITIDGGSIGGEYVLDYLYANSVVTVKNVTGSSVGTWIYEMADNASVVIEDSTFDCSDYFVEYVGDEEKDAGVSLTLKNVTANALDREEVFYEVRGKLTAENCTFVSNGNDFVEDTADTMVVVLNNVEVTAAEDIFDDVYGTVTINGGSFTAGSCIFDSVDGSATINGGSFTAGSYGFDDVYGSLTVNDCEITSKDNTVYCSSSGSSVGHVVLNDGTYISRTWRVSMYPTDPWRSRTAPSRHWGMDTVRCM